MQKSLATRRPHKPCQPIRLPARLTRQHGFSLLEVVITVAILMSLTIAVASMLRAGFDVSEGLGEQAATMHRLTTAMGKIANDMQHAFYVSAKDTLRGGLDRKMGSLFRIEKNDTNGDKLFLTTMTHKPIVAGVNESEFTYVVYELKDSKQSPGRKDLYRAEMDAVPLPENMPKGSADQPPERLLAKNIKTLQLEFWNGQDWSKDYWDTGRGDSRNRLPKLVRVTIESWLHDRIEGDGQDSAATDEATEKLNTVVFITSAIEYAEMKEQNKSVSWEKL